MNTKELKTIKILEKMIKMHRIKKMFFQLKLVLKHIKNGIHTVTHEEYKKIINEEKNYIRLKNILK